jgi:uncharacterized protein YprB with RNaseH-like and TPR domain
MPRPLELYLDVETDFSRNLTVVGFFSSETGLVQLVGNDITRRRLAAALPRVARMFTFNGHAFDLPCIRKQLGLDLRGMFDSCDLMWESRRAGMRGGQKVLEGRLGFERSLEGMDGMDAIRLWSQYERGDAKALESLLAYNAEDLEGLRFLRREFRKRAVVA